MIFFQYLILPPYPLNLAYLDLYTGHISHTELVVIGFHLYKFPMPGMFCTYPTTISFSHSLQDSIQHSWVPSLVPLSFHRNLANF